MRAPEIFTPEYYIRLRELEADGWWNAAMRDITALLLANAALPNSGTLLDVGCGSGQTMEWFTREHPGWRAVGLDLALEGLVAAREAGIQAITRASALRLPHPDQCVELVLLLDVLQHLPLEEGDLMALVEARRILKPGGYLFLRTNAQSFPRSVDDPEFNFHRYEPDELRAKITAAGFSVLYLSRLNALLGLAEIPRELRANSRRGRGYHGHLATLKPARTVAGAVKRKWLGLEGRAVAAGWHLPLGRSIVALCQA
jgi:SAM-dependent methyltransferase